MKLQKYYKILKETPQKIKNKVKKDMEELDIKDKFLKNLLSKVTRIEVIDHSGKTDKVGRVYTNYDVDQAELVLQDNNQTLKIFINQ